jgi:hypothetical protein
LQVPQDGPTKHRIPCIEWSGVVVQWLRRIEAHSSPRHDVGIFPQPVLVVHKASSFVEPQTVHLDSHIPCHHVLNIDLGGVMRRLYGAPSPLMALYIVLVLRHSESRTNYSGIVTRGISPFWAEWWLWQTSIHNPDGRLTDISSTDTTPQNLQPAVSND